MTNIEAALRRRTADIKEDSARSASGLDAAEQQLVLRLADRLVREPTRPSRELAADLGLARDDLIRYYRIIRALRPVQELLTFESPLRRRVSFLRRELQPHNIPVLKRMFGGEVCQPNQVEMHPALVCNLRCRACPNCRPDSNGQWHFIGYPQQGAPLTAERLHMIQNLFLQMGVKSFSFGGGGEPSLSDLLLPGITYLRSRSEQAEISLYTNGIFPEAWGQDHFETVVGGLNKIRFSIDAATAVEWSQYKGRSPMLFETLWQNIARMVAAKQRTGSNVRIGASCLISSYNECVEAFLVRARDTGLDFCDIKEIETCYGEKSQYKATDLTANERFGQLLEKIQAGRFAPMDVVVDDNLVRGGDEGPVDDLLPSRCWVAVRGRMLTIGPYGELYPCSDAANPGSQYRRAHQDVLGQLDAFASPQALQEQYTTLWEESLPQRNALSRSVCAYCVPSHNNFNLAVEKLFRDWQFGIDPEDQPFAIEYDHYQQSRGLRQ